MLLLVLPKEMPIATREGWSSCGSGEPLSALILGGDMRFVSNRVGVRDLRYVSPVERGRCSAGERRDVEIERIN